MSGPGIILVIDDEAIVRVSCKRTLEPMGYVVDTANDGIEGLRMLGEKSYDLVLTDLKMPNMDGMEVAANIHSRWPEMKVILITGYSTIDTAERAEQFGLYHYMEKPYTPDDLIKVVSQALL